MVDRDRLIELLKNGGVRNFPYVNALANHLLANGVILPPCKVGDVVYDICTIFDESTLKPKTVIKPRTIDFVSKVGFIIESKDLVIGEKEFGKTVFLTKEEAEKALAERKEKL
jgi:hypothetical protein